MRRSPISRPAHTIRPPRVRTTNGLSRSRASRANASSWSAALLRQLAGEPVGRRADDEGLGLVVHDDADGEDAVFEEERAGGRGVVAVVAAAEADFRGVEREVAQRE